MLTLGFFGHVLSGINSDLKSTRDYWPEKHPETEPLWLDAAERAERNAKVKAAEIALLDRVRGRA